MRNKLIAVAAGLVGFVCLTAAPGAAKAAALPTCPAGTAATAYCSLPTCPAGTAVTAYCTVSPSNPTATTPRKLTVTTTAKQVGNTLTVTFSVTNSNGVTVGYSTVMKDGKKVTVTKIYVPIPKGFAYVSSSPRATISHGEVVFTVGAVKAKSTLHFMLKLRVLTGTNKKVDIKATTTGTGVVTRTTKTTVRAKHHGKVSTTKVTG